MTMNFSPSELGIICAGLENIFVECPDALNLSVDIIESVKAYFNGLPMGDSLFEEWLEEYTLTFANI